MTRYAYSSEKRSNRFRLMARYFDDYNHLARFLGVSPRTVQNWISETAKPCRAAIRLARLMEHLEATDLHPILVAETRIKKVKKKRWK